MQDIDCDVSLSNRTFYTSYETKIKYANRLREQYGNDILAALAVGAIKATKHTGRMKLQTQEIFRRGMIRMN
jgi:hypothetical protein